MCSVLKDKCLFIHLLSVLMSTSVTTHNVQYRLWYKTPKTHFIILKEHAIFVVSGDMVYVSYFKMSLISLINPEIQNK